jgi:aminoglycoside phosphotransferase (APT) family kinase protein
MLDRIANFLVRHGLIAGRTADVSAHPLQGGLESSVFKATVRNPQPDRAPATLVVKQLRGVHRREAAFYRQLWAASDSPPAVRYLGSEKAGDDEYLYLECVESTSSWPWADCAVSAAVCQALARLHHQPRIPATLLNDWDYEAELAASAEHTIALASSARDAAGLTFWRRLGDLRRVVASLGRLRSRLLERGTTVVHGDVHPGNVIIRGHATDEQARVVFVDWARARIGSPLEDVASWLHSLGCWEPEARRRHDTLLRAYLSSCAVPVAVSADLRERYWFASASNGLSGAIRYHLSVLNDPTSSDLQRGNSRRALPAWERVIRQTAAICATTPAR